MLVDAPENSEGFADANLITATGFYRAVRNVLYGGWHYIIHLNYDSATALQLAAYVSGEVYGAREKRLNVWGDWEHTNPPMELGIEYRTTERYLGKPVYVKLINCGNLPDGTTKEVAHGIENLDFIVGVQAIASNSSSGFNGHTYLPDIYNESLTDRWTVYLAGINTKNIRIFCGGGLAGCPVYVAFKYTKTTD